MDGNFELNAAGYYTPQAVALNEFLTDKLDSAQRATYGNYWSVQFAGNAETYLWQKKEEPVKGERYFGMLILAKSGKSTKFKRLKEEDYNVAPQAPAQPTTNNAPVSGYWDDKQKEIRSAMAVKTSAQVIGSDEVTRIESFARELYDMVDRVKVPLQGYDQAKATRAKLDDAPPHSDDDDPGMYDDGQPDLL